MLPGEEAGVQLATISGTANAVKASSSCDVRECVEHGAARSLGACSQQLLLLACLIFFLHKVSGTLAKFQQLGLAAASTQALSGQLGWAHRRDNDGHQHDGPDLRGPKLVDMHAALAAAPVDKAGRGCMVCWHCSEDKC